MDLQTVTAIRAELESALAGRRLGKIFQLSRFAIAIDFRLPDSRYLFISIEPGNPRTYLIRRRLRDLEKTTGNPSAFSLLLKKQLSDGELRSIEQAPHERVLLFVFDRADDFGEIRRLTLAVQLTGSSSNLFLLDRDSTILESLRQTEGAGQHNGDIYQPPARSHPHRSVPEWLQTISEGNISEALDAEDLERSAAQRFQSIASAARSKLKSELTRRRKLIDKLKQDLAGHGDAEQWKRFGDLLLANASTARREGDQVVLVDYFDAAAPEIRIEVDENDSLTAAAEKFFKRYTKARNAQKQISDRLETIEREIQNLEVKREKLEEAIESGEESAIAEFTGEKKVAKERGRQKPSESSSATRVFVSPDGYEILVGKKAKDNDFLTFRLAKSLDTWMHAADYPGSHVVIRNPNRKEIPHSTLIEAAQLAAFYSQGKTQPKAAVHYTQKKFVNKPKGAAPGLVSLASFKTILVEPKIGEAVMKTE